MEVSKDDILKFTWESARNDAKATFWKETEKLKNKIVDKAKQIDMNDVCHKVRNFVDDFVKTGKLQTVGVAAIGAFGASGIAIMGMIGSGGAHNHHEIEQMKILQASMDKMYAKLDNNHAHLKAFFVKHDFTTSIMIKVEALMHHILTMYKYQTKETVSKFLEEYEQLDIQETLLNINSRIRHPETNPMIAEAEAHPLESRARIQTWEQCIRHIFVSLYIAYGIYQGLHGTEISFHQNATIDDLTMAWNTLNEFIVKFECKRYWPMCVEAIVLKVAGSHPSSNAETARILKEELDKMKEKVHTEAEFVIVVYDDCFGCRDHCFKADTNNVFCKYRHEDRCFVVYRTLNASKRTREEKILMLTQLDDFVPEILYDDHHEGMKHSLYKIFDDVSQAGLVGLIKSKFNPQIANTWENLSNVRTVRCRIDISSLKKLLYGDEEEAVVIAVPHQDDGERTPTEENPYSAC